MFIGTVKPADAKAGCKKFITDDGCNEVADIFEEKIGDPIDLAYYCGFIAGLGFPVVPKGAETYGMSVEDYARNSLGHAKHKILSLALSGRGATVVVVDMSREGSDCEEVETAEKETAETDTENAPEGDSE